MQRGMRWPWMAGVVMATAATAAFGATNETHTNSADQTLQVGLEGAGFGYEEPGMEEQGGVIGLYGRWRRVSVDGGAIDMDGRLQLGRTDYEGVTWGGDPAATTTRDRVAEAAARVGPTLQTPRTRLFPYVGLGYRYWNQDLQGAGGYEREIHYLYAPIGARFDVYPEGERWSWGIQAEYNALLAGRTISHLGDAVPALDTVRNDQDDGHGVRLSLDITRQLGGEQAANAVTLTAFYEAWDVAESNTTVSTWDGNPAFFVYEPENSTELLGLRVSLDF